MLKDYTNLMMDLCLHYVIYLGTLIHTHALLALYGYHCPCNVQGGSDMTGTDCGFFTHKSVSVIFESPCIIRSLSYPSLTPASV
jgi:hypothetical protein